MAPDPVGRVSLVGDDGEWLGSPTCEGIEHLAVMQLSAGNLQPERSAVLIYGRAILLVRPPRERPIAAYLLALRLVRARSPS